jgi:gamma-glutamyltranspeptidase/glutathione hydrolase
MSRPRLAVAAGNAPAARAAETIARAGGNAVDACLTSAITAWVAEPFFASLGGSGFVAVRAPDGRVEVYDGNNAMPSEPPSAEAMRRVYLDYSNGMYTGIGGGSVAAPGVLAAVRLAWERHGSVEWPALFGPAIAAARGGIKLPLTSAYYLSLTWDAIYSAYEGSATLFGNDGAPLRAGAPLEQPALADALEAIAEKGPSTFYTGELGRELAAAIAADGGCLTLADLAGYEAVARPPLATVAWGWRVESNPPPAMGGAVLAYMLALLAEADLDDPVARLRALVEAEHAAMGYRRERYSEDPGDLAALTDAARPPRSAATTHTSAADGDGLVCALTESNGYGSGLIVHGVLLNNTLGEEELNPFGPDHLPGRARCHSNMCPTIATGPDRVVGLGSPGADRIVGAIVQTLMAVVLDRASLADAVASPRAHLAPRPGGDLLCYEPGLPGDRLGWTPRPYDAPHMFFGAVQAASVDREGRVDAAHDPRRSGATAIV